MIDRFREVGMVVKRSELKQAMRLLSDNYIVKVESCHKSKLPCGKSVVFHKYTFNIGPHLYSLYNQKGISGVERLKEYKLDALERHRIMIDGAMRFGQEYAAYPDYRPLGCDYFYENGKTMQADGNGGATESKLNIKMASACCIGDEVWIKAIVLNDSNVLCAASRGGKEKLLDLSPLTGKLGGVLGVVVFAYGLVMYMSNRSVVIVPSTNIRKLMNADKRWLRGLSVIALLDNERLTHIGCPAGMYCWFIINGSLCRLVLETSSGSGVWRIARQISGVVNCSALMEC